MKKLSLHIILLFVGSVFLSFVPEAGIDESEKSITSLSYRAEKFNYYVQDIYNCLDEEELSFNCFYNGLKAFESLKNKRKHINDSLLVVIDFSLESDKNRFFLINLNTHEVIYKKRVAHGRRSGDLIPTRFSNENGSKMSSLGAYICGRMYDGKYKNSVKLKGQEYSNNLAYDRGVVIHAADYATEEYLQKNGRLGRSYGCPALPHKDYKEISEKIKEGTVLFIYQKDHRYLRKSRLLKERNYLKNFY